jgi:thiol-disulfide isomerase/thioredoxin
MKYFAAAALALAAGVFSLSAENLTALPADSAGSGASHWEQFFRNGLTNSEGQEVSPTVLEGKFVLLYFTASWCAPCKPFTPKLAALRNQAKEHLEVVVVSQDRSEADHLKYMQDNRMEWPAVKWADHRLEDDNEPRRLMGKYHGWGLPSVAVLSPSGEVVDAKARMKIQFLPEENLERLQDFNLDETMDAVRENNQEKGTPLGEEEEKEILSHYIEWIKTDAAVYNALHELSLQRVAAEASPSWEQLLADFYRAQRAVNQ